MKAGVKSADDEMAAAALKLLDAEGAVKLAGAIEANSAAALRGVVDKLVKGPSGSSMATAENMAIIQKFLDDPAKG
jgi:hypothetical protein